MTIRIEPGTQPRTGLPPFRPYVYRGTGADTLTGGMTRRQLGAPAVQRRKPKRCDDCGYLTTAPGHRIACVYIRKGRSA